MSCPSCGPCRDTASPTVVSRLLRARALLLVAGTAVLVVGLPSAAVTSPSAGREGSAPRGDSTRALGLLATAADAATSQTWKGVQHVVSVRDGQPSLRMLQVTHRGGRGSVVQDLSGAVTPSELTVDAVDPGLLSLLAAHYDLAVSGTGRCAGHPAVVVEARRPGQSGARGVAARFWVDRSTGLVLRRDVLDRSGSVVRSAAYVSIDTEAPERPALELVNHSLPVSGSRLDVSDLLELKEAGWPVSFSLPAGLDLFEARWHGEGAQEVLQTSYSDGLSTTSLFLQRGVPAATPSGTPRRVGKGTAWVSAGTPERVVWSGGGYTWTLVSDAPTGVVDDALLALPHLAPAPPRDGVAARAWRGMSRVGGWLNPFE